jgi:hypothetical protein
MCGLCLLLAWMSGSNAGGKGDGSQGGGNVPVLLYLGTHFLAYQSWNVVG